VLKYIAKPRWILWHLVVIATGYGFLLLGRWQWERRIRTDLQSGTQVTDWQNMFYAFQWWIFALFVVWFWWKFLSDGYNLENSKGEREISNN
jgi:hypothetical protein